MKIIKNSLIYIAVSVFSGALSFLLLPILTDNLLPESYGIYEIYRSSVALLQGLMIFGTNTLIFGNYFKWSGTDFKIFIHNSIFIFCCVLVLFVLISLIPQIHSIFYNTFSIPLAFILIAILTVFFQSITNLQTTIFQIKGQAISYASFTAGFSLISFLLIYIFVVNYKLSWDGPVYSILFSSIIFFFVSSINFYRIGIKINFPLKKVRTIIFLGAPLILTHLSGWIIEAFDKFMITSILDVSSTGNYSVNYKFGLIVFLIQVGVLRAWSPFFYKTISLNTIQAKMKIVKFTYLLILALVVLSVFVIFISPLLFEMFVKNDLYNFSYKIIFFVSIGYFFDALWKIFAQYLINLNLTKLYSLILFISATSNLILNYFLINFYGIEGAAIATCIAFFIGFFLTWIATFFYAPMPWLLSIKNE